MFREESVCVLPPEEPQVVLLGDTVGGVRKNFMFLVPGWSDGDRNYELKSVCTDSLSYPRMNSSV